MASEGEAAPPMPQGDPPASPPATAAASVDAQPPEEKGNSGREEKEQNMEYNEVSEPGCSGVEPPVPPGTMARGNTCRILFACKGYTTWDVAVQQTILDLNPRKTEDDIEEGITKEGGYTSAKFLCGER